MRSPRRGRWDTSRIPDVGVIGVEQWQELRSQEALIELNEPPPALVVEVVIPSTRSADYRAKRAEYMILGISEYWIGDPEHATVTILRLLDDWYEATEYAGDDPIQSVLFPDLKLTATKLFGI